MRPASRLLSLSKGSSTARRESGRGDDETRPPPPPRWGRCRAPRDGGVSVTRTQSGNAATVAALSPQMSGFRHRQCQDFATFSAWSISSIRSSASSSPTESRSVPGPMPSSARASSVRFLCVVVAGWVIRLLASPRLLEMRMISSAFCEGEGRLLAALEVEGRSASSRRSSAS